MAIYGNVYQDECFASGCCWEPSDDGSPYCFFPTCSDTVNWVGDGIGFTQEFLDAAKDK